MSEVKAVIRPSTVLPAIRTPITIHTADGLNLVGEVARPVSSGGSATSHPDSTLTDRAILCFHPLPTHGGMMDSHIYKKAANRLPAMAGITVVRFNTRGTTSERGTSEGEFGGSVTEKFDVEAAIDFCFTELGLKNVWIVGWSFGTEIALKHAHDKRIRGYILLSPPLMRVTNEELLAWKDDPRTITCLVPEYDEFLSPKAAREKFAVIPRAHVIEVLGAKHLWVGEPFVYRVLSEICAVVNPDALPLPEEF